MNINDVKAFISATEGKIFSIRFVKRSTGELRSMVCRTGVKKHLAAGKASYDPAEKKLIFVYDMANGGYRSIPEEGIQEILINGTWIKVKQ